MLYLRSSAFICGFKFPRLFFFTQIQARMEFYVPLICLGTLTLSKIFFPQCSGMKKIATNTTNSIRTHATTVRSDSYQFVVFSCSSTYRRFIADSVVFQSLKFYFYALSPPASILPTTASIRLSLSACEHHESGFKLIAEGHELVNHGDDACR